MWHTHNLHLQTVIMVFHFCAVCSFHSDQPLFFLYTSLLLLLLVYFFFLFQKPNTTLRVFDRNVSTEYMYLFMHAYQKPIMLNFLVEMMCQIMVVALVLLIFFFFLIFFFKIFRITTLSMVRMRYLWQRKFSRRLQLSSTLDLVIIPWMVDR
jgi:hypothetical protein